MGGAASILLALRALYYSSQTLLGRKTSLMSYFWVEQRKQFFVLIVSKITTRLKPDIAMVILKRFWSPCI